MKSQSVFFVIEYLQHHTIEIITSKPFITEFGHFFLDWKYGTDKKHRLEAHIIKHQVENPFKCNLCYKTFRTQNHRQRHIQSIHQHYIPEQNLTER